MANPKGNVATLKHYQPKWRSGATQVVRIPIALTDQTLAYAHQLDQGELVQTDVDTNSLLRVIQKLETVLDTPRNNFSREKKSLLKSAIQDLQALVTSDTIRE